MEGDALAFRPPVLVGERVAWLGSGSGLPQGATVRWIGRVPEITTGWTVGIELDHAMPVGGIDGTWQKRKLFSCEPKHGLLVPLEKILRENCVFKTRHSIGENYYNDVAKPQKPRDQELLRQLSLPQSISSQEFISRVLPRLDPAKESAENTEQSAITFKSAASTLLTPNLQRHQANFSPPSRSKAQSSNSLDRINGHHEEFSEQIAQFRRHLDALEKLKNHEIRSKRHRKIGQNPDSLYALARPDRDLEPALVLGLIGERKDKPVRSHRKKSEVKNEPSNAVEVNTGSEAKAVKDATVSFIQEIPRLSEEAVKESKKDESKIVICEKTQQNLPLCDSKRNTVIKNDTPITHIQENPRLTETTVKTEELYASVNKDKAKNPDKPILPDTKKKQIELKLNGPISVDVLDQNLDQVSYFETNLPVSLTAEEVIESENCSEHVTCEEQVHVSVAETLESESPALPTPATRKKKQPDGLPPVPCPRRKHDDQNSTLGDDRNTSDEWFDTTSVLYEPSFLKEFQEDSYPLDREVEVTYPRNKEFQDTSYPRNKDYQDTYPRNKEYQDTYPRDGRNSAMTEGRFRRIDEDDIEFPEASNHRILSGSVSAPGGTKKGLFSFFRWFKKNKPVEELDLDALNYASAASSPLFTRSRIINAESVDTLYSIATVSSFAFVPPSQYQREPPSQYQRERVSTLERRKKRRAPEPPLRRDTSLPNTLEYRVRARHRRTSSESDRRSFSHVQGKRKAPPPPKAPPRLYPSLPSIDRSLPRKKRPAPLPPRSDTISSTETNYSLPSTSTSISAVTTDSSLVGSNPLITESHPVTVISQPNTTVSPPVTAVSKPNTAVSPPVTITSQANTTVLPTVKPHTAVSQPVTVASQPNTTVSPPVTAVSKPNTAGSLPVTVTSQHNTTVLSQSNSDSPPISLASNPIPTDSSTAISGIVPEQNMGLISSNDENVVCNDTLKLERGVLKPNKSQITSPDVTKVVQLSPVSPRPWYKRKSLEKRKEKAPDDGMPEVGFSRPGVSNESSPMKFFFTRSDEKKKDDKRKSGLSMLANISELDREAAEICRKENAQKQLILAASDAKFYAESSASTAETVEEDSPKRNSTRELISLFNSISNVTRMSLNTTFFTKENETDDRESPLVASKPEVKTAAVIGTKEYVDELDRESDDQTSRVQALFDARAQRQRSLSPAISTIAEMSEPSSSAAATLNEYAEPVWTCLRCTLENQNWKMRCDACSSAKPNYNPIRNPVHKSDMDFEIDWDRELEKYFTPKEQPKKLEVSGKLLVTKQGDVSIKTETSQPPKEDNVDEIRRKRLAFFMKSLGNDVSVREAAAKQSLDEAEKSKLKGMLKEMKNSIPKQEDKNNTPLNLNSTALERLPDVITVKKDEIQNGGDDEARYGAIRKVKVKPAEALLVTTTTLHEDILVKKKTPSVRVQTDTNPLPTEGSTEDSNPLKKARRVGDGPFELMRIRDLANIVHSKNGGKFPTHVYANIPQDEDGIQRLATTVGVAEFRAAWDTSANNTLAVNRLLRRLESAIADGRHEQAAALARELADLKVTCSVTRQRPSPSPGPAFLNVEMFVEDKVSHQGPIPLQVQRSMTLAQLKTKVQTDFQIPSHVQRWILGKKLATDENKTLEELGVVDEKSSVFLYLVAPEPEPAVPKNENVAQEEGAVALPESTRKSPPKGKGWYFNYEEDRYSYCDSDSDRSPEKEVSSDTKAAAAKVIRRTLENAIAGDEKTAVINHAEIDKKVDEPVLQPATRSKPFSPKYQRPPLRTSQSLPESESVPTEPKSSEPKKKTVVSKPKPAPSSPSPEKSVSSTGKRDGKESSKSPGVDRPRSRSIFDLIKPQSNDTLKKDLKVISVNAVKETIEKLARQGEEKNLKGWRCGLCTLLNSPTRPGCAACTAPRPIGYIPPAPRPVDEELRRLRRDQDIDLTLPDVAAEPEVKPVGSQHYLQLVDLDGSGTVANTEEFECPVCLMPQGVGEGVVLRECLHTFCKQCLAQTVEFNEEAEVKCPYRDANYSCESVLQQREIKALVSRNVFEQHLARGISQAENRIGNAFHCKTPDCQGWCILDDNANEFRCPVCRRINCLTCQAIHEGVNCKTYQDRLRSSSETDVEAKRTRTMLEEMVQRGDAMACPTCQVVLMKKWGCDWLRCSMCKTEICWVTRGPRWGPQGKGDTSAGCQCGVNGIKCHPKCNYCH